MKKTISCVLSLVIICSSLLLIPSFSVSAGKSQVAFTLANSDGELDASNWYDPNDCLALSGGALVIPDSSNSDIRLISKQSVEVSEFLDEALSFTASIKLTSLPQGKSFIVALGLSSIESYSGEAGNLELAFTNAGGLKLGITYYNKSGTVQTVAAAKSIPATLGNAFTLAMNLSNKSKLSVKINNSELFNISIPANGNGKIGFLQTGNCGAEIRALEILLPKYEAPENTNVFEDFESGSYNDNLFTLYYTGSGYSPQSLMVEELDGNKVLFFRNTGRSYFGTKYEYSNFEYSFDVPYFSRQTVKDENGRTIQKPNDTFCISWGDSAVDFNGWDFTTSPELIHYTQTDVWGYNSRNSGNDKFSVNYAELGFSDLTTNEGFSIKFSVIDGYFTLYMKSLKDTEYTKIAEAFYENARAGFIKLWSTSYSFLAIDNICIKNMDPKPNLITVPFKKADVEAEDYVYTDEGAPYSTEYDAEETDADYEYDYDYEEEVYYEEEASDTEQSVPKVNTVTKTRTKTRVTSSSTWVYLIIGIASAVVVFAVFAVIYLIKKKKGKN